MGFSDTSGASGLRGIMLLDPRFRGTHTLQKVTQLGVQLRLYPELDASGNPLPIRTGRELSDVGGWVNGDHYGIIYLGGNSPDKEKVTMLVSIKGDDKLQDPSQRRGLRIWDQLRNTLYQRLSDGNAPSEWSRWVAESMGSVFGSKQRSKAKPIAFARGLMTWCMTQRGPLRNVSHQSPMLNCVFYFPPMAQNALIALTMAENADSENVNTDDYDRFFMYNKHIVDIETGCLITFGKPGQADPRASQPGAGGAVNFGSAKGSGFGARGDDDDTYKVEAKVLTSTPCPVPLEVVRRACQGVSWDDLLNVYADEKALVAALEVGFPDELIVEAFMDFPMYLSERLLEKRNRALADQHQPAAGYAGAYQPSVAPAVPPAAPPAAPPTDPQPTASPVNFGAVGDMPLLNADEDIPFNGGPQATSGNQAPVVTNAPQQIPASGGIAATPTGAQPNGVSPQGMDDMMKELARATEAAEAESAGAGGAAPGS